jgi:hypothetical protein
VEMIWIARPKPEEANVALAPRMASRLTWSPSTFGTNAPFVSKGFKQSPEVT